MAKAERSEFETISREALDWIAKQGDERTGDCDEICAFLIYSEVKRPAVIVAWRGGWGVRDDSFAGENNCGVA